MFQERAIPQNCIVGVAWLLLGLSLGLHFPDIDTRLQWLISPHLLLHRSIVTHGLFTSLLLFWLATRGRSATQSRRLFVIGATLALAVHLCFDFFPLGWRGFALIHIPIYGRTTVLFSQLWIILSIVGCLYVAYILVRNTFEFALAIGNLTISFIIAAVENSRAVGFALMLIVVATTVTLFVVFRVKGRVARG